MPPLDVTMPKLSDTMEEGRILKWLKVVGDAVKPGDVLAEVETDKANMELEAYDEGVLTELRVGEGDTAPVGAVIAVLTAPGETTGVRPAAAPPSKATPAREETREPPRAEWRPTVVRRGDAAPAAGAVRASPLARRLAREHGLDLTGVAGTGPGGRVVEKDVEATLAARGSVPARAAEPPRPAQAPPPPTAGRRVELSRTRRTTARRMAEAKREVPHFYASAEIGMDEAARLKASLVARGGEWAGLSYTHLVLKAVGLALRKVPEINASADGAAVVLHEAVHLGMATATDDGLVVPVVRDCDRVPLATIVREARGLAERARAGRFGPQDLVGGTFTVSNLGMFPVSEFAAILNPPQAAILAVGTVRSVPVVRDGGVVPGRVMTVTLSSDHRLVDGVLAGRFLGELKALLESPLALVL